MGDDMICERCFKGVEMTTLSSVSHQQVCRDCKGKERSHRAQEGEREELKRKLMIRVAALTGAPRTE